MWNGGKPDHGLRAQRQWIAHHAGGGEYPAQIYIGDLKVGLVAPDGSVYVLHNHSGDSANNINRTCRVNLPGEAKNRTWRLRVNDNAARDIGKIDGWNFRF